MWSGLGTARTRLRPAVIGSAKALVDGAFQLRDQRLLVDAERPHLAFGNRVAHALEGEEEVRVRRARRRGGRAGPQRLQRSELPPSLRSVEGTCDGVDRDE